MIRLELKPSSDFFLKKRQKMAFDAILAGKNVFITGPGGCGKSFLIEHVKDFLTKKGKKVAVTALTGKAAVLIGGRTIHSWAGIQTGTKTVGELYTMIRRNITSLKKWITTDLLIIDEISMMSAELWNKLVALACVVRKFPRKFCKTSGHEPAD